MPSLSSSTKTALVLVVGVLAPLLDTTIVNVAIHALGNDLDASVSTVQWVSTGYLLALAMAIPVTGWAAERFGAKRIWLFALVLFLAGSMLCGVAWNIGSLIVFRVLQGVATGLMLPILQTLLIRAADGRGLGRLMAVATLPALIGPILGPVIGGLIIGHLSWRWVFYVNVPVCVVAFVLARRTLPLDAEGERRQLDVRGLLLLSPALALIIYGLSQTEWLPLATGAALLVAFVARTLNKNRPLIDLRLFGTRSFAASCALLFLSGLSMYGALLLLPLYYQQERGLSVVQAGLLLAPQGFGSLLARGSGMLADRFGSRPVVLAGIVLTALGTAPFAFGTTSEAVHIIALVVRGAGLSTATIAVMVGAYRDLRPEQVPDASSVTRIVQQVGGSFGAAVLAMILQRQGMADAFGWTVAFAVLAVVPALMIPRRVLMT